MKSVRYKDLNLGNGIFEGWNDQQGLMICGYEWGNSKKNQEQSQDAKPVDFNIACTFSNKVPRYGQGALSWPYDNRIKRWFALWGHPLDSNEYGQDFDKSIIQTNWANTCNHQLANYSHLLSEEQVNNFINHISTLKPKIILFMGSQLIHLLRNPIVKARFEEIIGTEILDSFVVKQKKEFSGRKFKIYFCEFENCQIIGLPHPSSSRGLSDRYIELFEPEMNTIISQFKKEKAINP